MRRTFLAFAALSTAIAMPVQAKEPIVLKPYGPWNVDFGEDSCRLQRLFGSAENTHVLVFKQYWPSDQTGLTLAGPALRKFHSDDRTDLSFREGGEQLRVPAFSGTFGDIGDALIFSSVSLSKSVPLVQPPSGSDQPFAQMDVALGKTARFVAVRQGGHELHFETGALDKPFEVLNQCTLDLLGSLGLDPQKHVTMKSEAKWLNRDVLVRRITAEYPSAAAQEGEQAILRMRVIVGADGMVETCQILKATTADNLESPACKIMKRAQFAPAIDAAGQPFRSLYASSIVYRAP